MEDIIKSIKAALYDRTTSPLFGTLFFSWFVWNYKFVLVIFSGDDFEVKLNFLEHIYSSVIVFDILIPDELVHISYWIIFPAITAYIFLQWFPIPAEWAFKLTRDNQKKLKVIKQQIEDETPLTQEESNKLRAEIRKIEYESDKRIIELEGLLKSQKSFNDELNGYNEELKKGNHDLNVEIDSLRTDTKHEKYTVLNNDMFSSDKRLITEAVKSPKNMLRLRELGEDAFLRELHENPENIESSIEDKENIVSAPNSDKEYKLTPDGKKLLFIVVDTFNGEASINKLNDYLGYKNDTYTDILGELGKHGYLSIQHLGKEPKVIITMKGDDVVKKGKEWR